MVSLIISFMVQPVSAGTYDDEKNSAQNEIYEAQKAIEELEGKKADVDAYIEQIDASIDQMNANLASINTQVTVKQQEIDTSNELIAQKEAEIVQQHEDMKKRIKFMYENADTQYVEMILGSENFSDFLNKADFFSELTTYDRNMVLKMEETKIQLQEQKAQLEQEMSDLQLLQADALAQKAEAETLMDEKEEQMAVYESQIDLEQKEIEAQQAILARINQLEALEGSGNYYIPGSLFSWPVPSVTKANITSHYGTRYHPISHTYKMHYGVDIGASYGANIIAACTGTVTIASYGYNGGAGNYVAISHGNGLSTVYYHCSSLLVTAGQTVVEGTPIALIGSTGSSTGNHLHFGVISGGGYVNPQTYLGY